MERNLAIPIRVGLPTETALVTSFNSGYLYDD